MGEETSLASSVLPNL